MLMDYNIFQEKNQFISDVFVEDGMVTLKRVKKKDGKYQDLAHPINKETREMFNSTILGAYERAETPNFEEEF